MQSLLHTLLWALLSPLPSAEASREIPVAAYETGYTGDVFRVLPAVPVHLAPLAPSRPRAGFELRPSRSLQVMRGFGGNLTEACSMNLLRLGEKQRGELLRAMFAKGPGAGFDLIRLPAGASDFADGTLGSYTYDDAPAADPQFLHFDVSRDQKSFALLREARLINPDLGVMMSPWSAPAWMKDSGSIHGGNLLPSHYGDYAAYLLKVISVMRANGVPVESFTVENEPYYGTTGYPSMTMDTDQQAKFISQNLGPALRRASADVSLFGIDHNWDLSDEANKLLGGKAGPYLKGVAFHCYGGSREDMQATFDKFPGREILQTECTGFDSLSTRRRADLAGDFHWWLDSQSVGAVGMGTTGALGWNLCLDEKNGPQNGIKDGTDNGGCTACRGMVKIDFTASPPAVVYNPEFRALEQVSKFVRRGAHRIALSGSVDGLQAVAFRNPDGGFVFVAHNGGAAPVPFQLRDGAGRALDYVLGASDAVTLSWKP